MFDVFNWLVYTRGRGETINFNTIWKEKDGV